ncbi:MotB family protein [Hydrocarboniclastica marina]|uniref:Type VI secretion system protein TssL n=1 Tax=Hydrocarboniclastica marina TaxID=2259620 RepID=A0A4V1D8K1_9ALTE|nr:MotB family protein [Hydrocarboniclastica marina]MAL97052.1 type VI secretion system protein TssL [Alteromonadaceae bacterium]QCF25470.1 type VI secretion system protein TssL [Hydrocarboniclastica marina]|tara:strand:+ start:371 stop:1282 length:912 start_codon:yes stop_codon:yes gene_type:complete
MDELPEEEKPGIPAWVVTFADLMSLLMCFFVLLLSFSEIDAQKFKQIAGAMSQAFGVQREVIALEPPEGTSAVFDQFSPAPPEPTLLNEVRQTQSEEAPELETLRSAQDEKIQAELKAQMDSTAAQIRSLLEDAIEDGRIEVEQNQQRIEIRIEEKGSFPSGSAKLTWELEGLLLEMAELLARIPGKLSVEGHTDNIPIRTEQFESNWNLSAARASAVANVLLASGEVDPQRLAVTGLADTKPRFPNTTPVNRAENRRVEIIVDRSGPLQEEEVRLRELLDRQDSENGPAIIDLTLPEDQLSW